MLTLAISDVPGDAEDVIASGPTVADPTTRCDAINILNKYDIPVSLDVTRWLESDASETPKPGDPRLANSRLEIISTPLKSLLAAQEEAEALGIPAYILGDNWKEKRGTSPWCMPLWQPAQLGMTNRFPCPA